MHLLQGTFGSSQNRKDFFKQSIPVLSLKVEQETGRVQG
jgi:hypothetical protein